MKHKKKTHKGFTLLEVVVAISVLLVGVLGALSLLPQGVSTLHRSTTGLVVNMTMMSFQRGIRDTYQDRGIAFFTSTFWNNNVRYSLNNPLNEEGLFVLNPNVLPFQEQSLVEVDCFATMVEEADGVRLNMRLNESGNASQPYDWNAYV